MGEVIPFPDRRMNKLVGVINGLVESIRDNTQGTYDLIAPLGFKTRKRIPISKMNMEQLDRFNEEMNIWILKNYPELMVEEE